MPTSAPPAEEGDYVTLVPTYQQFSDAARGPLSLQRIESAFGLVTLSSGNRLRVRACHHPVGERSDWWYDREAVCRVHISCVPERLRDTVRPGWGDYCVLSSDATAAAAALPPPPPDAATAVTAAKCDVPLTHNCVTEGPLQPGNLGVVVGVDAVPDAAGGLSQGRYVVRACHNGLLHRYPESALRPVIPPTVEQLHDSKVPPGSIEGRMDKLSCHITLLEPPQPDAHATATASVPREVARVLVRRVMPGCPTLVDLACLTVVLGRKYWVKAQLVCQDGALMLASLKPVCWDIYAPCGVTGEYRPLRHVTADEWAGGPHTVQQQQPCTSHFQQDQSHFRPCPERVSLLACRASAKGLGGGDGVRSADESGGGSSGGGRLLTDAAAAAGPGPWYLPYEDQLRGVFEWDSGEAPLVVKPGGVTLLHFTWDVAFADLVHMGQPHAQQQQQQQQQQRTLPLLLQTTHNVADIAAAITASTAGATAAAHNAGNMCQQQQQLPTVIFGHLSNRQPPLNNPSGRPTPSPTAPYPMQSSCNRIGGGGGDGSCSNSGGGTSGEGSEGGSSNSSSHHSCTDNPPADDGSVAAVSGQGDVREEERDGAAGVGSDLWQVGVADVAALSEAPSNTEAHAAAEAVPGAAAAAPVAAAECAEASRGRSKKDSSGGSSDGSSSSGGRSSPTSRHKPRSLSCDGRISGSSTRPRGLAGVAFATIGAAAAGRGVSSVGSGSCASSASTATPDADAANGAVAVSDTACTHAAQSAGAPPAAHHTPTGHQHGVAAAAGSGGVTAAAIYATATKQPGDGHPTASSAADTTTTSHSTSTATVSATVVAAAAPPVTPDYASCGSGVAHISKNSSSSSSSSSTTTTNQHRRQGAVEQEVRRVRVLPPVLPVLGASSSSSDDDDDTDSITSGHSPRRGVVCCGRGVIPQRCTGGSTGSAMHVATPESTSSSSSSAQPTVYTTAFVRKGSGSSSGGGAAPTTPRSRSSASSGSNHITLRMLFGGSGSSSKPDKANVSTNRSVTPGRSSSSRAVDGSGGSSSSGITKSCPTTPTACSSKGRSSSAGVTTSITTITPVGSRAPVNSSNTSRPVTPGRAAGKVTPTDGAAVSGAVVNSGSNGHSIARWLAAVDTTTTTTTTSASPSASGAGVGGHAQPAATFYPSSPGPLGSSSTTPGPQRRSVAAGPLGPTRCLSTSGLPSISEVLDCSLVDNHNNIQSQQLQQWLQPQRRQQEQAAVCVVERTTSSTAAPAAAAKPVAPVVGSISHSTASGNTNRAADFEAAALEWTQSWRGGSRRQV